LAAVPWCRPASTSALSRVSTRSAYLRCLDPSADLPLMAYHRINAVSAITCHPTRRGRTTTCLKVWQPRNRQYR
jgi:hypothetical protein